MAKKKKKKEKPAQYLRDVLREQCRARSKARQNLDAQGDEKKGDDK
jgi:hypothetical protein